MASRSTAIGGGTSRPPTVNCFSLNLNMSDFIFIHSQLNNSGSTFLVDSQADISIFKASSVLSKLNINYSDKINIKGITNDTIKSIGSVHAYLEFPNFDLNCKFHLVSDDFNIPADGILGRDFLRKNSCTINYNDMCLTVNYDSQTSTLPLREGPSNHTIALPARAEVFRKLNAPINVDTVVHNQEIYPGVYLPRTIISPNNPLLKILNTTSETIVIPKNISLKISPLSEFYVFNISQISKDAEANKTRTEQLLHQIEQNVNPLYKNDLISLCKQFPEIFLMDNDVPTINNFYEQKLRINDDSPVYIKNYRLPHSQKDEIDRQVNKLLENNLIEPSQSNFNSPIILVPKKGQKDKWRLCIDYRQVNKKLIVDKFPLPRIDEILDGLGRAKFFSVLDLHAGFHQIPLDEIPRHNFF